MNALVSVNFSRENFESNVASIYILFLIFEQVVVVVGNSQSGQDISLELVEVAKEIHISIRSINSVTEGLSKVIQKHPNLHLQPQVINTHTFIN